MFSFPVMVAAIAVSWLVPTSPTGRWMDGTAMAAPSVASLNMLLPDGRVLVTGGYTDIYDSPTANTQIYDPYRKSWSVRAPMSIGRAGGTATVLRTGDVLVTGGLGPRLKALDTAEIYHPSNNVWSQTVRLPGSRFAQSASLLPNGRVLIAGGIVNSHISRSTLIFDPVHDTWSSGPRMRFPHALQSAVTLSRGRVLLAGGYGGGPEYYDPASRAWTAAAPTFGRTGSTMTVLGDGTVLLAGGESRTYHDLRTAAVFDPTLDRWIAVHSMHQPRNSASAMRLPSGEVLVVGGEQVVGRVLDSAEIYRPNAHAWAQAPPLRQPRSGAVGVTLRDGTALVCGGVDFGSALTSCEIYTG